MTVRELKSAYERKHPNGKFFDRETLRFFGEKLSTMRVIDGIHNIVDLCGGHHRCYVLGSLQRNHPFGPTIMYFYFDIDTIDDVFCTDTLN